MALKKACVVSTTLKNTGVDCDITMGATAMIVAVPKTFSFSKTDFADPVAWFKSAVHAVTANRIYPIFGSTAPIRFITNNKESDVIATLDDGLQVFIRYGFLNRQFATTSGGLCYAKALQSFLQSGYSVLEFDKLGRMLARDNRDGTYSGLRCDFMFSPSPDVADFRNPWKTNFQVSFDPTEYVGNGVIFDGAAPLLDIGGLIDSSFEAGDETQTIAHISVKLIEECSETDLIAILDTALNNVLFYKVTDKADGTEITITGVSIVNGEFQLAGTFVSGHTYIVEGTGAAILYANSVKGFEFTGSTEVVIP